MSSDQGVKHSKTPLMPLEQDCTPREVIPDVVQFDGNVFYVTIPCSVMLPMVNTMGDFGSNRDASFLVFSMFCLLIEKNWMNTVSDNLCDENGDPKPRTRVYMEYLIGNDEEPVDQIQMFNVIAIRFIFVVYDGEFEFYKVIEELIKLSEKEYSQSVKRAYKGGGDAKAQSKMEHPVLYATRRFPSMKVYLDILSLYAFGKSATDHQLNAHMSEEGTPTGMHHLHAYKIFSRKSSIDMLANYGITLNSLCTAQKNAENQAQAVVQDKYKFGVPELVYEIPVSWFNLATMVLFAIPRSHVWGQGWPTQDIIKSSNELAKDTVECINRFRARGPRNYIRDNLEFIKAQKKTTGATSVSRNFKCMSKILLPEAELGSTAMQTVLDFVRKQRDKKDEEWTTYGKQKYRPIITDPKLCTFGQMMSSLHVEFDDLLKIIHVEYAVCLYFCVLDAYRHQLNLHQNVMCSGAASQGKSATTNAVLKLLIDGSVERTDHRTGAAGTTDEDENYHITYYDELPEVMIDQSALNGNKNADSTGNSRFKTELSACEIHTTTIQVNNNVRKRVKIECQCIGVNVVLSNLALGSIAEPVQDRFIQKTLHNKDRTGYGTITARQTAEYETDEQRKIMSERKSRLRTQIRVEQFWCAIINQAIVHETIPPPNLLVIDVLVYLVETQLKKVYGSHFKINPRTTGQIKVHARTLVIVNALWAGAQRKPRSSISSSLKGISGQEMLPTNGRLEYLTKIVPYMVCTDSIAIWVVLSFWDQLVETRVEPTISHMLNVLSWEIQADGTLLEPRIGYHVSCAGGDLRTSSAIQPVQSDGDQHRGNSVIINEDDLINKVTSTSFDQDNLPISKENLEGVIKHMLNTSYKGRKILQFDKPNGTVRVNASYVKDFIRKVAGKYQPKKSSEDVAIEITTAALANKHTSKGNGVPSLILTPFPLDPEYPHILRTIDTRKLKDRNRILKAPPRLLLTCKIGRTENNNNNGSNNNDSLEDDSGDESMCEADSDINQGLSEEPIEMDINKYAFSNHLKRCELGNGASSENSARYWSSMVKTSQAAFQLNSEEVVQTKISSVRYPDGIMFFLCKHTGISPRTRQIRDRYRDALNEHRQQEQQRSKRRRLNDGEDSDCSQSDASMNEN